MYPRLCIFVLYSAKAVRMHDILKQDLLNLKYELVNCRQNHHVPRAQLDTQGCTKECENHRSKRVHNEWHTMKHTRFLKVCNISGETSATNAVSTARTTFSRYWSLSSSQQHTKSNSTEKLFLARGWYSWAKFAVALNAGDGASRKSWISNRRIQSSQSSREARCDTSQAFCNAIWLGLWLLVLIQNRLNRRVLEVVCFDTVVDNTEVFLNIWLAAYTVGQYVCSKWKV